MTPFDFNDEFSAAFKQMEESRDCLYITGNAGTGKTTLLRYFLENTEKRTVVLAPTGLAAVNIGGQTIHSFFRLPPGYTKIDEIIEKWKKVPRTFKEIFRSLDTIVIDEVSMVRVDTMDAIDRLLKFLRGVGGIPFGGVQMIFFGDLAQLPPVVEDGELDEFFRMERGGEYFFNAKVFERMQEKPKYVELTKIYRQTDNEFIGILNKIRSNSITKQEIDRLNQRVQAHPPTQAGFIVKLTTNNNIANKSNSSHLESIPKPEFRYKAIVEGEFGGNYHPVKEDLVLKEGAQIMLVKNNSEYKFYNGSMGVVVSLAEKSIKVKLHDDRVIDVPQMTWSRIQYKYNEEEKAVEEKVVGAFTQYPIKLAWAVTIHKAQGQTFERALVDFTGGTFAHGQAYVALSRCRSLSGLYLLKPLEKKDVIFDNRTDMYKDIFVKFEIPKNKLKCSGCNAEIDQDFNFCPKCGKKI